MNLLQLLLRSSKRTVLLACAVGFAGGAGSVGLLALIHAALNWKEASPGLVPLGFVVLCLAVLLTRVISQSLLIRLAQGSVFRLCTNLCRQILAVPLRDIETVGSHRLLAALTEDVPAIASALFGVPILCVNAAILLCCLAYLGWLSPLVFFGVLGFLAVGVLSYQLVVLRALGQLHLARQEQDTLMKHFRGLTDGVKELKLYRGRREAFLGQFLEVTAANVRDRNIAGMTVYAAAGTWGQLLFFVCIGLLLFTPFPERLSQAVVSGYVLTILYSLSPLETIMTWLPIMGRARVALGAVEDLGLSLAEHVSESEQSAISPQAVAYEMLELAGVSHAYQNQGEDGFLLGPLALQLRKGELVFLVGGNGSGKTTLAKLLVGLYAPSAGEVRLNGRPVGDSEREQYRHLFSAIFSDGHLFDRLLGMKSDQVDAEVGDYLDLLELDHKVRSEGGKFSTTELSQGQRRRLALLTAYMEDRPVYVFDEWAADQDPRFKEIFYTRLLPELKERGKAVFVISHDDRYFHVADRVLTLDSGVLQEKWEGSCLG
jgi:putative pyoverdin transport system ATP-binding/permease protein